MTRIVFLISRLTCLELLQNKAFRILLTAAAIAPMASFIFSNLFMQNIGKVFIDGLLALNHLFAWLFILFFTAPLLGRDLESKTCYFLLCPPVTRNQYLIGRFIGLLLIFLLLFAVLAISGTLITWVLFDSSYVAYMAGLTLTSPVSIAFFLFLNYLSVMGAVIFIFSWATGIAELMLFSSAILFLSWIFPPVLNALQNPEVAKQAPSWSTFLLDSIYQLLPHLNGTTIATSIAYGEKIPLIHILAFSFEHISYVMIGVLLASIIFKKRDL